MPLKTQKNNGFVADFICRVSDSQVRDDCYTLIRMMEERTADKASMWGKSCLYVKNLSNIDQNILGQLIDKTLSATPPENC